MLSKNKNLQHYLDRDRANSRSDNNQTIYRSNKIEIDRKCNNTLSLDRDPNIKKQTHSTLLKRDRCSELFSTIEGIYYRQSDLTDRDRVPIKIHRSNPSNFQIVDLEWQSSVTIEHDPVDSAYIIYLPLAGDLESQDLPQVKCAATTAILVNPSRAFSSKTNDRGRALAIAIDRQSIEEVLTKLLNRALKQPLVFESQIDLTTDFGESLKQLIEFLGLTNNAGTTRSPLMQQEIELALLTCLLKGLNHNYANEIIYQTCGALACYVSKARSFIESHLREDLDLMSIATAAGASPRLLQKAFSQHCGCSPMRFVTQTRLEQIRADLERSSENTRIIDVMMNYGITQGGKFAKEYQQLFGEKPSDTLKRASQIDRQHPPLWEEIDDRQSERVIGGAAVIANRVGEVEFIEPLAGNFGLWSGYLQSIGIDSAECLRLNSPN